MSVVVLIQEIEEFPCYRLACKEDAWGAARAEVSRETLARWMRVLDECAQVQSEMAEAYDGDDEALQARRDSTARYVAKCRHVSQTFSEGVASNGGRREDAA